MITYNNIINRFKAFVDAHYFLKTFTHGSPSGVDLDKFEVYPACHVSYTGATYDSTSKEYSFEVFILDLPPDKSDKANNQAQLVSNSEQAAEDILADMRNGGSVFTFGHLYSVTSASVSPLEDSTSNALSGVLLSISIEVGFTLDSCNAPLKGVTAGGSAIPSGVGGTTSSVIFSNLATTTSTMAAGSTSLTLPVSSLADNPMVSLQGSLSFVMNFVLKRQEFWGINTTASASIVYTMSITTSGAGVVEVQHVGNIALGSSLTTSFASAETKELTFTGSVAAVVNANYIFLGLRTLSTVSGSVKITSISTTINNRF